MGWEGNREWEWDQNDKVGLTRFVMFSKDSKAVADFINRAIAESELPRSGYDFHKNNHQRRKLIEAIYNALSRQGLNYDRSNDNESSQKIQLIPTPEKLFHGKKGTCLDLSILFCAICWHYDLLPILILTERLTERGSERHAFVAVSLTYRRREWEKIKRQGQQIFKCKGLTNNSEDLFELEDYLAVECTGFARSTTLSDDEFKRNSDGLLTFQDATKLGRQKLDNAAKNKTLKVAIDIAHSGYKNYWWHEICHKHIQGQGKSRIDTFFKVEESGSNFYVGMELFKRNPIAKPRPSNNNEFSNEPDFQREQEGDCRYQGDQFLQQVLRREALTANSKGKPIVIIGEPGSGKTTLLRYTANYLSEHNEFPIWISLADIKESSNWLEEYLYKRWLKDVAGKRQEDETPAEWKESFDALIKSGKVWVLLDGADEMAVDAPALKLIKEQITQDWLKNVTVVLTCRLNLWEYSQEYMNGSFDIYRILQFKADRIHEFINKRFGPDNQEGKDLNNLLDSPERKRLKELV